MPSRVEQASVYCNHCDRPTMHHRTVNEPNHVAHLLATVFCCLVWLPFWILLTILNGMERPAWFCSQCGHEAGALTPEQAHAANQAASADFNRQLTIAAAKRRARDARLEKIADAITDAYHGTLAEIPRIPSRVDAVLKVSAGDGNEILHWFFRIAVIAILVVALGSLGWYMGGITVEWLSL